MTSLSSSPWLFFILSVSWWPLIWMAPATLLGSCLQPCPALSRNTALPLVLPYSEASVINFPSQKSRSFTDHRSSQVDHPSVSPPKHAQPSVPELPSFIAACSFMRWSVRYGRRRGHRRRAGKWSALESQVLEIKGTLCQVGPCEERQILVWWAKTGPEENPDGVSFGISAGETSQDRANSLGLATTHTKGSKPLG